MDRRNSVRGSEAVEFIVKAAQHMSQARREKLPSSQFAVPAPKAKKLGVGEEIKGEAKGKYPIPDLKHARNALARVSQHGTSGEREAVRSKVYAKYPELKEGFEERHGESPTAKSNIKKVEQGGVGKESCALKTASARLVGFFDELEKIGGPPPLKPWMLGSVKGTKSLFNIMGGLPKPMVKGSDMEKEEGLGSWFSGKALGAGVSKVAPKMMAGGTGGRAALQAIERKGWGTVGMGSGAGKYVGRVAPPPKPIGSLAQNIAERGISL